MDMNTIMTDNIIKIRCNGFESLPIESLTELQGGLKELSTKNYERLKNSILKYGFSFPAFIWQNKNKKYIIDAHQRVRTIKKMIDEGYRIEQSNGDIKDEIPCDYIFAADKKEAKEKLLQLNSQYGKITYEGLYEFENELDAELNIEAIYQELDLPGIDIGEYVKGYSETDSEIEINEKEIDENTLELKNNCPKCGFQW